PPRTILLTGATGFLGSRLLCELLNRTAARVYCLVRGGDAAVAVARVRAAVAAHGFRLDPASLDRIVPVAGSLDRPRFGLPPGRWAELAGEVDAVYHSGAWVNLVLPYGTLRPANVLGTR